MAASSSNLLSPPASLPISPTQPDTITQATSPPAEGGDVGIWVGFDLDPTANPLEAPRAVAEGSDTNSTASTVSAVGKRKERSNSTLSSTSGDSTTEGGTSCIADEERGSDFDPEDAYNYVFANKVGAWRSLFTA